MVTQCVSQFNHRHDWGNVCCFVCHVIFSGDLAAYLPAGITIALISGMILRAVIGLMSSYPGIVADIDALPSAILGLSATAIALQMPPSATPENLFVAVLGAIALTSLFTGAFLFLLGLFKVGELIRFIPYSVIGGFLAGVGWLLVQGSSSHDHCCSNLLQPGYLVATPSFQSMSFRIGHYRHFTDHFVSFHTCFGDSDDLVRSNRAILTGAVIYSNFD